MSKRQDREKKKRERAREERRHQLAKHRDAEEAMTLRAGDVTRQSRDAYVNEWRPAAEQHVTQGDYEWMASAINGFDKVLEIGCGSGQSTISMIEAGHTVVAIDENTGCVNATADALRAKGLPVAMQLRGSVRATDNHHYSILYSTPTIEVVANGGTIIEGDVLQDEGLRDWLSANGPFDAVVCWMLGTHAIRREGSDIAVLPEAHGKPGMYRLQVQNAVYILADQILRPGGILHIVDRGEAPTQQFLIDDTLRSHREQANPTTLEVESTDHRLLPVTGAPGGIELKLTPGESGRMPEKIELALVSVTARKPGLEKRAD